MRADLPSRLPLICPACRHRSERGLELATLSLHRQARHEGDEVIEGLLRCDNEACRRMYPIIDGVPLLLPDPAPYLRGEACAVAGAELDPEVLAVLVQGDEEGGPLRRQAEHLSIYLDAHWGDRAQPPPDGPPGPGFSVLAGRLADLGAERVGLAVELGCGVGRGLAELARGADLAVGVDLNFAALRRARALLSGKALRYARRVSGQAYTPATISAGPAAGAVALLCGDALDPPLCPGTCQRAVALNLLDSVARPAQLLAVLDGLLAPGGELVLAAPFAWDHGVTTDPAPLGVADPAAALRGLLAAGTGLSGAYAIMEEADLPWSLRRDARSAHVYLTRYLRARKLAH